MIPIIIDAMEPLDVNDTVVVFDEMKNFRHGKYIYDHFNYVDDMVEEEVHPETLLSETKVNSKAEKAHSAAFVWSVDNPYALLVNTSTLGVRCTPSGSTQKTAMMKAVGSNNLYFYEGKVLCD